MKKYVFLTSFIFITAIFFTSVASEKSTKAVSDLKYLTVQFNSVTEDCEEELMFKVVAGSSTAAPGTSCAYSLYINGEYVPAHWYVYPNTGASMDLSSGVLSINANTPVSSYSVVAKINGVFQASKLVTVSSNL